MPSIQIEEKNFDIEQFCPKNKEYLSVTSSDNIDKSKLIANEKSFVAKHQEQPEQAMAIFKERRRMAFISLLLVLIVSGAVAASIVFVVGLVAGWPLLVLPVLALLPSVGLAIASLVARRSCNAMKTKLDISNNLLGQLDTDGIPNASTSKQNPSSTSPLSPRVSGLSSVAPTTRFSGLFNNPVANQPTIEGENQSGLTQAPSSTSLSSS